MPVFEDAHRRKFSYIKDQNYYPNRYQFYVPGLEASRTNSRLEYRLLVLN
jgi:hypothetical protein